MVIENYLLHPELVDSMPIAARFTKSLINMRAADTLADDPAVDPNISIVIRALNEATKLEKLFEDIHKQLFEAEVEVVVVDNESSDHTPQVAAHYGAEVVTLPRESFTYPKSMNLGVEAASHDVVFLTVGHALLSNTVNLHAGARHFVNPNVAGVYGTCLPNYNASTIEKISTIGADLYFYRPAHRIKKATMGVLGATNAVISKEAWQELGRFDERYEIGGEDTALAKQMLLIDYEVIKEPALTVHHSHGLGAVDSVKQLMAWNKMLKGPHPLNRKELIARRPDLRQNGINE
jgi:cellulose synthase/poly-beta-1,6-N-acetylglucosamine synthase-like glycosyltransferase